MPGSKLIEYGELQGRLAITVDAAAIDFDDETSLTRQVLQSRVVGAAAVILEGKVPWGSHALDRQLMLLQADGRTEGKEVWAMRPIASERWASIPLWWVLDASALFQQASAAGIMAQIDGLPFLPPPTEGVILDPNPEAVTAGILDELGTRLDLGCGWVYVRRGPDADAVWARMAREMGRATTAWGLRWMEDS